MQATTLHGGRRFCAKWRSSGSAPTRCFAVANRSRRPTVHPQRKDYGELVVFFVGILTFAVGLAMTFLPGVGLLSLSLRRGRG